jgi:transposase
MSGKPLSRSFSKEFKIAVLVRLDRGERLAEVAKEAGIRRKLLYEWRDAFRRDGEAGLNRKRGPKPGPRRVKPPPEPAVPGSPQELEQARARIAELERKIGQQQIELDFFVQALRALGEPVDMSTVKPSSIRSSKP